MTTPQDVLQFWLGPIAADGTCDEAHRKRWFKKDADFDEEIRKRFGSTLERAEQGEHDDWAETPHGRLALVILLDQLTRNIHRNSPKAWSNDARALELAIDALDRGMDREMPWVGRAFLCMPLMHAEDLQVQARSLVEFKRLAEEAPAALREQLSSNYDYAVAHRNVIKRFGRFPHRNTTLGRESSSEELAYLAEHRGF